jgi:hypothetical protein
VGTRGSIGLCLAWAAALLGAYGCGGSSSSSKPLTRAELTAKADAICRRVTGEVDWSKVKPATLPTVAGRLAGLEEQAASELDELTPPASMLAEWRLIVDGFRLTAPQLRQLAHRFSQEPGVLRYVPLTDAQRERADAARVAGIRGCERY